MFILGKELKNVDFVARIWPEQYKHDLTRYSYIDGEIKEITPFNLGDNDLKTTGKLVSVHTYIPG